MKKKIAIVSIFLIASLALSACDSISIGSTKNSKKSSKIEKDEDDEDDEEEDDKKEASEEEVNEWMKEASKEVSDDLLELIGDEYFAHMIAPSSGEVTDIIEECKTAKIATDKFYVIDFSEEKVEDSMAYISEGDFDYDDLSDAAKNYMISGYARTLTYKGAQELGMNYVAAMSVMNSSKAYAKDYELNNQFWIYDTNVDGFGIAVYFTSNHEGVVSVSAMGYFYNGDFEEALDDTLEIMRLDYEVVED